MLMKWDATNDFDIAYSHNVLLKFSWEDESEHLQCIIRDLEYNIVLGTLGVGNFLDGMIEYYTPLVQADVQPIAAQELEDETFNVSGGYTLRTQVDSDYITDINLQNIPKAILRLGDAFILSVALRVVKPKGVRAYSTLVTGGIAAMHSVMKAESFISVGTLARSIKAKYRELHSVQDIAFYLYSTMLEKGEDNE